MKNIFIIIFITATFFSTNSSFANTHQEARAKEAKETAAAIATHRPISPKLFIAVENYIKRNFPEHWSNKSQWVASPEGFKRLGPSGGGYLIIRWNGKLVFRITAIDTEYWIGDWNDKNEVH